MSISSAERKGLRRLCCGLASAGLFWLAMLFPPFGESYYHVAAASAFISSATQLALGAITAFLTAGFADSLIAQSKLGSVVSGAAAALAGAFFAPFLAAFPPVALLLCRINCPEGLFFPRPYEFAATRRSRFGVHMEDVLSVAEMCLIAVTLVSEFFLQIEAQGADAAVMWSLFGSLAVVAVYVWRMAGLRGSVAIGTRVLNAMFRCAWYIGWLHIGLIALFSYLPAVIIS